MKSEEILVVGFVLDVQRPTLELVGNPFTGIVIVVVVEDVPRPCTARDKIRNRRKSCEQARFGS